MCAGANGKIRDLDVSIYMGYYGGYLIVGDERFDVSGEGTKDEYNMIEYLAGFSSGELAKLIVELTRDSDEKPETKGDEMKNCKTCGSPFEPRTPQQKYCRKTCMNSAVRLRKSNKTHEASELLRELEQDEEFNALIIMMGR